MTSACFQTDGNFCSLYDELRMLAIGWHSSSAYSFKHQLDRPSGSAPSRDSPNRIPTAQFWSILIQDPAYRDSFESQRSVFAPLMSPPFPGGAGGGGKGRNLL